VEQAAFSLLTKNEKRNEREVIVVTPGERPAKKSRYDNPVKALLDTLIDETLASSTGGMSGRTAAEVAEEEIKYYRNIPRAEWPTFEKTLQWWNSRTSRESTYALSVPSSTGLPWLQAFCRTSRVRLWVAQ
jgi:hypothetical protein